MTTGVYFDLDGTLLEYTAPFDEILARTLPVEVTEEMMDTFTELILSAVADLAEGPYRRAFADFREEHGIGGDPEVLAGEYVRNEISATRVAPSVRRLVEATAAHHRTGILTNGDGRVQRRKLAEHGLDELVDAVVVSNEVGARKPEPAIFEEARERLPADAYVYVGDSFEEDVQPAREQGFQTVYVGDEHRPDAPVSASGTEELAAVLLPLVESSADG